MAVTNKYRVGFNKLILKKPNEYNEVPEKNTSF